MPIVAHAYDRLHLGIKRIGFLGQHLLVVQLREPGRVRIPVKHRRARGWVHHAFGGQHCDIAEGVERTGRLGHADGWHGQAADLVCVQQVLGRQVVDGDQRLAFGDGLGLGGVFAGAVAGHQHGLDHVRVRGLCTADGIPHSVVCKVLVERRVLRVHRQAQRIHAAGQLGHHFTRLDRRQRTQRVLFGLLGHVHIDLTCVECRQLTKAQQ